jgi:tripartite-type tricarboxylate transporter receptor subunit TctC
MKLVSTAFALLAAICASFSFAQPYPAKPITLIVPFGPGGTTDLMARLLQAEFERAIGTPLVVTNKAGAGGAIALAEVARAPADGYTLAMTTIGPQVLQPSLKKLSYQPDSFDFICGTYDVPLMMMVTQASPFKSFSDVINYAKQNSGKLTYGSSGQGTALHIAMAALLKRASVEGLHVPFKSSGDMATALLGGHIMVFLETPAVATQYQLRPLAVLADKRLVDTHPSVPTAMELGFDIRGTVWGGLISSKGVPAEVRAKLEAACAKATSSEGYRAGATRLNSPLVYRDSVAFARYAASEAKAYAAAVREFGLEEK